MDTSDKKKTVPLDHARLQLAKIWFGMAGPIVLFLIAQSVLGKYQNKVQTVWSWALPTIVPTLSLMIAALAASALEPEDDKTQVKRPFYVLACWLSVIYLLLVVSTILIEPFSPFESLELMTLSNLWLAPCQGLVASVIGVLFFTKKSKEV